MRLYTLPNRPSEAPSTSVARRKPKPLGVMPKKVFKGGPGSGHHGHAGIPGKQGGSLPGSGGDRWTPDESRWYIVEPDSDWNDRVKAVATVEATQKWADDLHSRGWTKEQIQEIVDESYGTYPQFSKRNYSPDWGAGPGEYKSYRTGTISEDNKRGIWFGPDPDELDMYQSVNGDVPILEYTIILTNPAVFKDKNELIRNFWPSKPGAYPHREWLETLTFGRKFRGDPGAANRYIDEQIITKLKRKGYDGLVLMHPELPATREIAIWSEAQVRANE